MNKLIGRKEFRDRRGNVFVTVTYQVPGVIEFMTIKGTVSL